MASAERFFFLVNDSCKTAELKNEPLTRLKGVQATVQQFLQILPINVCVITYGTEDSLLVVGYLWFVGQ